MKRISFLLGQQWELQMWSRGGGFEAGTAGPLPTGPWCMVRALAHCSLPPPPAGAELVNCYRASMCRAWTRMGARWVRFVLKGDGQDRKLLTLLIVGVNDRTGASQHLSIVACIPKGFFSHAFCLSLKAKIRSLLSLSTGSHAQSCSVLFTCLYRKDVKTSQSPDSPISTSPHPHNVWSFRGDFEDCAYTVYLHRLPCSYLWTLDAFQVCLQPEIQKSPGCSCTMSATTRKITFKDAVKWKDDSLYISLVPCKLYVGLGSGSATKGTW